MGGCFPPLFFLYSCPDSFVLLLDDACPVGERDGCGCVDYWCWPGGADVREWVGEGGDQGADY